MKKILIIGIGKIEYIRKFIPTREQSKSEYCSEISETLPVFFLKQRESNNVLSLYIYMYRITAVPKVETVIIASITGSFR